jgi:hypothetical protein
MPPRHPQLSCTDLVVTHVALIGPLLLTDICTRYEPASCDGPLAETEPTTVVHNRHWQQHTLCDGVCVVCAWSILASMQAGV